MARSTFKNFKSTRSMVAITAVSGLALAACGGAGAAGGDAGAAGGEGAVDTAGLDFITIAAGDTSGPYYMIGSAMATAITEKTGIDATVQATGASVENIQLLTTGDAEIAFAMGDSTRQALDKTAQFADVADSEKVTALTALYPNYVQIVTTKKSGITSVDEMRGKRIGVGDINSGVELNARMIFEAHGMTYDDVEEDYLSYSEAIDQMKNGLVDAAFVTSGLPNASVMDLATTDDVVIVPIEGDGMKKLLELYPFFKDDKIPGGTYDEAEDVPTASIMNQLLLSPKLTEDQAYVLTKAIFESLDTIHAAHNAANGITLDSVEDGLVAPLNPGSKRYFDEVAGK